MISNSSKSNCINDMSSSMARTANWRRQLQTKYLDDCRNTLAAEKLDQLADEVNDLSDEAWADLSPHYGWCSGKWSDAVSLASRHVVFRNVTTLPAFISDLVGILSQPSSVAA
jgi:hypothetical protein